MSNGIELIPWDIKNIKRSTVYYWLTLVDVLVNLFLVGGIAVVFLEYYNNGILSIVTTVLGGVLMLWKINIWFQILDERGWYY